MNFITIKRNMTMSGRYKSEDLYGDILTTNEIQCTVCQERAYEMNIDDYDAADKFFIKGWRRTLHHCYCPKCAAKKLKQ